MTDLAQGSYEDAVAAIERHRQACDAYLAIIDGQRAALRLDALRVMIRIGERLDVHATEILRSGRDLSPIRRVLGERTHDGARAQHLRDLLTAAAADAALVQAHIQSLSRTLARHRLELAADLDTLEAAGAAPRALTASHCIDASA